MHLLQQVGKLTNMWATVGPKGGAAAADGWSVSMTHLTGAINTYDERCEKSKMHKSLKTNMVF